MSEAQVYDKCMLSTDIDYVMLVTLCRVYHLHNITLSLCPTSTLSCQATQPTIMFYSTSQLSSNTKLVTA